MLYLSVNIAMVQLPCKEVQFTIILFLHTSNIKWLLLLLLLLLQRLQLGSMVPFLPLLHPHQPIRVLDMFNTQLTHYLHTCTQYCTHHLSPPSTLARFILTMPVGLDTSTQQGLLLLGCTPHTRSALSNLGSTSTLLEEQARKLMVPCKDMIWTLLGALFWRDTSLLSLSEENTSLIFFSLAFSFALWIKGCLFAARVYTRGNNGPFFTWMGISQDPDGHCIGQMYYLGQDVADVECTVISKMAKVVAASGGDFFFPQPSTIRVPIPTLHFACNLFCLFFRKNIIGQKKILFLLKPFQTHFVN